MTDHNVFATNLAILLKSGLSKDERSMAESAKAYGILSSTIDMKNAMKAFLDGIGLVALQNPTRTKVFLIPDDSESIFAMTAAEVRKNIKGELSNALLAFAYLLVLSTFYPTRSALNNNTRNGIAPEDVYATAEKIVKMAALDRENYGASDTTTIADQWAEMPVSDNGKGGKKSFQEFYVLAALRTLTEQKMAQHKESEGLYYPTDRLALTAMRRFEDRGSLAALMASAFHDQNEMD